MILDPPAPETFIENAVRNAAEKHAVPGISIALVRDAAVEWTQGFGVLDREWNTPVGEDSVFEAASMSKPVFAYAVMKMRERGLIDLDKPLRGYLRQPFVPEDRGITARQVLSHTSGLPDMRSRTRPLRVEFPPGEKWQYSGEGYAYLQAVVTELAGHARAGNCGTYELDMRVCGTNFDGFMRTEVLGPLGMTSSGYLWHSGLAGRLARGHDEAGRPMAVRKYTAADAARYGAMGGLLTTAGDYARFLVAVMAGKAAWIPEMLRPQVHVEDGPGYSVSWGLGWKVTRTDKFGVVVSHGGDQAGFHCHAEMVPERKTGFVLLTNGENGWKLIRDVAPEIARLVHGTAVSRVAVPR